MLNVVFARIRGCGRAGHRHDPVHHQDVGGYCRLLCREIAGDRRPDGSLSKLSPHGPRASTTQHASDFTNHWDIAGPCSTCRWCAGRSGIPPSRRRQLHCPTHAGLQVGEATVGGVLSSTRPLLPAPWPWILGLVLDHRHPELKDIWRLSPSSRRLIHDIAYPACRRCPSDGSLMVAPDCRQSSTVLTHLNWGVVHGPRFLPLLPQPASEHHYVNAGRVATVLLFPLRDHLVLDTAKTVLTSSSRSLPEPACSISALVLVAHQCLVRNRGHGQPFGLAGVASAQEEPHRLS